MPGALLPASRPISYSRLMLACYSRLLLLPFSFKLTLHQGNWPPVFFIRNGLSARVAHAGEPHGFSYQVRTGQHLSRFVLRLKMEYVHAWPPHNWSSEEQVAPARKTMQI